MKILILCTTDSMIWNFLIPHIEWLVKSGNIIECACSKTGFYFDELISRGIVLNQLKCTRNPVSFDNIKAFFSLKKLVRAKQFEAIYCHEPVGGMLGRLVGKFTKTKVVYMSHGFHFFDGASLKYWFLYYTAEWLMSFMTDACITINKEDFARVCKMHAKRNYYVHGIGLQADKKFITKHRNEIRKELGFSIRDVVMISVGELSLRKNHIIILKAMQIINDQKLKLVICGDGILKEKLQLTAKCYGIDDSVRFTGLVRNVADYLNASDFMVFPSLWEGLGLAGLEALQLGIPVIASRRQGIKDYIINGKTGYTFNPDNAHELVDRIKLLETLNFLNDRIDDMKEMASKYSLKAVLCDFRPIYKHEF